MPLSLPFILEMSSSPVLINLMYLANGKGSDTDTVKGNGTVLSCFLMPNCEV